jgi:hypothetical protein
MRRKRIGLALSGGGVRGLGHVPALEVLDGFGIRMLEFHKARDVFKQAAASLPELQEKLLQSKLAKQLPQ